LMADAPDQTGEPEVGSAEYFKRMHPSAGHEAGLPSASQGSAAVLTPSPTYNFPPVPSGQFGSGLVREAGIGLNQGIIGLLGIPSALARGGWWGAHQLAPGSVGDIPPILYPSGEGSYGNALTLSGLTPSTPFERSLATGARSAGTAASLAPFGLATLGGTAIAGLGGGAGEALTEAGYPNVGAGVEAVSGLAGGYRGATAGRAARASSAAPASSVTAPASGGGMIDELGGGTPNIVPFPPSRGSLALRPAAEAAPTPALVPGGAASGESAQMDRLIALETAGLRQSTYGPILSHPFTPSAWLHTLANRYIARGALNSAGINGGTSTASRILGLSIGTGVGVGSSTEGMTPPISWQFRDMPNQPGNQPN
jgi:hypothetical protein